MRHGTGRVTRTLALVSLLALVGAGTVETGTASAQVTLQPKMGEPIDGLTPGQLDLFDEGKIRFEQVFLPADGLGPIFNDDSCASCHALPTTGGAGVLAVTRFGFADKGGPFDPMTSEGGTLLQALSISDPCAETVPAGANIIATRITPSILGAGLVEAIPDADLLAGQTNGGAAHLVQPLEDPLGPLRVGRFGWKSQVATIRTFSGDAALNEMGITNALVNTENAPNGNQALLLTCDPIPNDDIVPEDIPDALGFTFVDRITDFQRYLAPPPQTPRSGMTGEQVFTTIGCATCHTPSFTTGTAPEAALSNRVIHPYSDFLLHDMGSLGDGIVDGAAGQLEMRTASLWGVRIRRPLLHDGRVDAADLGTAIDESVGWHGGAAVSARDAYLALSPLQRDQLIAFLDSLGKLEFDMTGDGIVIEDDIQGFLDCFTGPGAGTVSPDDPCAVSDVDQDGDVDLDDLDLFVQAYEGPIFDCDMNGTFDLVDVLAGGAADCNGNGRPDSCDLADGTSIDANVNLIPDECEVNFRRGDCNEDDSLDIGDAVFALENLFGGAGTADCLDACDSNDDGAVDIADPIYLLTFLFGGGPQPSDPVALCGVDPTPDGLDCAGGHSACP